jgi:hypothetical protein
VSRVFSSVSCRAAVLAALVVACSDGGGTLAPEPGSYEPVGTGGAAAASNAGHGGNPLGSSAAAGGQTAATGTGGSGFAAAGSRGGGSSGTPGAAGSSATGAAGGVANGSGGSFGSGGFVPGAGGSPSAGASGHGGAAFGGSGGSLGGHAGALGQGSAGKSGAAGAPANVPATFSAVSSIIQANCTICHGSRMPRLTNSASLYTTLTSTTVKECGGNPLVKPNDPADSALLMLPNWQCQDLVMPQGCTTTPCLTDSELATITAWIAAGAPNK